MKSIKIINIMKYFDLELLAGEDGLDKLVDNDDVHSPGLELTGFLEYFPKERVQLLGKQEIAYLNTLTKTKYDRIEAILKLSPPCFIVTRNLEVSNTFIDLCNIYKISLLRTAEKTTSFIAKLNTYLSKELAEELGIHAVCINVLGIGVLLKGHSGIGKSETALSLIKKGHRLVSDDLTILKRINPSTIIGTHNIINRDFIAIRGMGLINVPKLFGASSIQEETRIVLEIELINWEEGNTHNSLIEEEHFSEYLGVKIKKIIIPVNPGRDLSTIIEVAVQNYKVQEKGYNALKEMEDRMFLK